LDGGKAKILFHAVPSAGRPTPEAPHLYINNVDAYQAALCNGYPVFRGVVTKNLPNYVCWQRALEA
jgi:hypothetical protein